jgi:hypothetical protein
MSRKNESITVSVDVVDKAALEALAVKYGCTWGEKPNISHLMRAIAQGQLTVGYGDESELSQARIKQGKAAISKISQGLAELSAILFK